MEQLYFYYYVVTYGETTLQDEYKEITTSGITIGKTYNEAVARLVDYYGDDEITSLVVRFYQDCDILEDDKIKELAQDNREWQ